MHNSCFAKQSSNKDGCEIEVADLPKCNTINNAIKRDVI